MLSEVPLGPTSIIENDHSNQIPDPVSGSICILRMLHAQDVKFHFRAAHYLRSDCLDLLAPCSMV